jgi:hypothetical protein
MIETVVEKRLTVGTRLSIAVMILVNLHLLAPFNLSDSPFARIFTTFRVILYFSLFIIFFYVLQRKAKIADVPGAGVILVLLLSMACSTYLGQAERDSWLAFGKEFAFVTYSVLAASMLRSLQAIKTLLRWSMYVTIVFVIISTFHILSLSNVLPSASSARFLEHMIAGQTELQYSFSPGIVGRESSLWFDANNFGYIVASQIVYLVYLLVAEKPRKITLVFRYSVLVLFVVAIVRTLSRGSFLAVLIGVSLFLFFAKGSTSNRLKVFLRVAGVTVFVVVGLAVSSSQISELVQRFYLATGLVGNDQAANLMGGMETERVITAENTYSEFLQKPVLGWGSGKMLGLVWNGSTGNHLGYLDILGHYGIIGFALMIAVLWIALSRLRQCMRYLGVRQERDVYLAYCLVGILGVSLVSEFFTVINMIEAVVPLLAMYLAVNEIRKNDASLGSSQ